LKEEYDDTNHGVHLATFFTSDTILRY